MSSFDLYQQTGVQCANWLSNSVYCPIGVSGLTLQDLHNQGWSVSSEQIRLPRHYHSRVSRVGIPLTAPYYRTSLVRSDVYGEWDGVIGPGIVIIETVYRTERTNLPYSSQLTKAAYQNGGRLADLRNVFMENVVNDDTLGFVRNFIYTEREFRRVDSICEAPRKSFQVGTPQYYALLGTQMGKIVVYFLLNSFGPGVRHIRKITTWYERYTLQLRFDIA